MPDLWPDSITESTITSPLSILREQASLLGQKTGNAVLAKVTRLEAAWWTDARDFSYTFYISAPTLPYRYDLFEVSFPIEMYPLKFKVDSDIASELRTTQPLDPDEYGRFNVGSEGEFLTVLSQIFKSRKASTIIQALLAQMRS